MTELPFFVCIAGYTPLTSIGTSLEPHRDFIGTSPKDPYRIAKGCIRDC